MNRVSPSAVQALMNCNGISNCTVSSFINIMKCAYHFAKRVKTVACLHAGDAVRAMYETMNEKYWNVSSKWKQRANLFQSALSWMKLILSRILLYVIRIAYAIRHLSTEKALCLDINHQWFINLRKWTINRWSVMVKMKKNHKSCCIFRFETINSV